jgi:hypothetical protein
MKTKNNKAAETTLLTIDFLLHIVMEWNQFIRKELGLSSLWYPNVNTGGMRLSPN